MQLTNTGNGWGWVARNLHWLMAMLILGQVALGRYAHELDRSPRKLDLMTWHKSVGVTLLLLAIVRLGWAAFNRRPADPDGTPRWQHRAIRLSHMALYGLMLAIPLSGWLYNSAKNVPFSLYRTIPWPDLIGPSERLATTFGAVHGSLVVTLLALLVVHAGAALWHHFIRGDDVLRRMLTDRT